MANPLIALQRTNTILYCRRWLETVHFYKKQICLPVVFENDWFVEFRLTDTSFLSIADSARATISDVQGQGMTLTWQVASLVQIKGYLEAQGIATTPVQRRWNALVFYCIDPEGHRLEFWTNEDGNRGHLNE
jgi:catechol 2,3-dioxygenase-like lactoylglutathione lyase family enzyme